MRHSGPRARLDRGWGRRLLVGALLLTCSIPRPVRAESGSTLTPDGRHFLVNKDVGAERWAISLNPLAPEDVTAASGAILTGNVFRSDGGLPSFVWCPTRASSPGTLANPDSEFVVDCYATDPCTTTAGACFREWILIAQRISLPAAFFLPPGGLGTATSASAHHAPRHTLDRPAETYASHIVTDSPAALRPVSPSGGSSSANLAPDGASFLSSFDLFGARWSMSLNVFRTEAGAPAVTNLTGNLFFPDGRPPLFVSCTERPESTGSLEDPRSVFSFSCSRTEPCESVALACRDDAWSALSNPDLPAALFLPPGGLGSLGTCGNGRREGFELCDGADVGGETCASLGFDVGSLRCRFSCEYDTSGCFATLPACGNGIIDAGEDCDPPDSFTPLCRCNSRCVCSDVIIGVPGDVSAQK